MVTDPGSADHRELSRRLRASIDMRLLNDVSRTAAPTTTWMRVCCTDHVRDPKTYVLQDRHRSITTTTSGYASAIRSSRIVCPNMGVRTRDPVLICHLIQGSGDGYG